MVPELLDILVILQEVMLRPTFQGLLVPYLRSNGEISHIFSELLLSHWLKGSDGGGE
ncbi:hypothetical protein VE02_09260 [Pseudogymnoascus sp. 03VT05]|nr:hypothetical protein VE02_09260 [Pseudogymnoascus sp. 03VT05]